MIGFDRIFFFVVVTLRVDDEVVFLTEALGLGVDRYPRTLTV